MNDAVQDVPHMDNGLIMAYRIVQAMEFTEYGGKKRGQATYSCALVAASRTLLIDASNSARTNHRACLPGSESRERGDRLWLRSINRISSMTWSRCGPAGIGSSLLEGKTGKQRSPRRLGLGLESKMRQQGRPRKPLGK